jgi:hypothetical protein
MIATQKTARKKAATQGTLSTLRKVTMNIAPQDDELPLGKIDDSTGIVDDRETNRDEGIGTARGEPRDKELK